jgi:hypothetical protein
MNLDFFSYLRRWQNQFAPRTATVDGKQVTACSVCPNGFRTTNPVNPDYPIYKCEEKEMKLVFDPRHVPRWCPRVNK